ncbi:MAG: hypothetical protein B7Z47_03535 [Chthoniobacter sp. 12-60-6]|nr:MAG: hypothetical protein B7Z47_03535 [Chthoniobacter sp. 12-60-6]
MKPLPDTDDPIVLRADFTDDHAWARLCGLISSPISTYGYLARMAFGDDPSFADVTPEALRVRIPGHHRHSFIVIADHTTFSE